MILLNILAYKLTKYKVIKVNCTRRTWAEIDLDSVCHNFRTIKKLVRKDAKMMAVVKADGYGHNAVILAREYLKEGVDWFAVSNIDEAEELRQNGVDKPILILGYTPPEYAYRLARSKITQTVYSVEYAETLAEQAGKYRVTIQIHIKVDTGMSRIGLFYHDIEKDAGAVDDAEKICRIPEFVADGIFTHFAVADSGKDGKSYTRKQFELFTDMIEKLEMRGIKFNNCHCCNSAAIIDYPEFNLDMVRPGIILYGLSPSPLLRGRIDIKPVMSLNTVVSHIKEIEKGVDISYGRTFTSQCDMRLATVPVGYADGYPRLLSSNGEMCVNGIRAKITGRVCMDQLMLDITNVSGVDVGDKVNCFGTGENGEVTADELADMIGTINYEITCNISKRVPRVFIKGGKEIKVCQHVPHMGYR